MKLLRFPHSPLVDDEPTEEQRELTATISIADDYLDDLMRQVKSDGLTEAHRNSIARLLTKAQLCAAYAHEVKR